MTYTPALTSFTIHKDPQGGLPTGLRTIPGFINTYSISTSGATAIAIPSGATKVIFSSTVNFQINCNGTADSSGHTDGSGSEINPEGYFFQAGNTPAALSAIGFASGLLSVSFYK